MAAHGKRGLIVIGAFTLFKAVALAFVGFGFLSLLHKDVAATIVVWVEHFRVDPRDRLIHAAIEKATGVNRRTLETLGVGTLVYAALFATEGIGLLLEKKWAEYMTLLVTVSFLPVEAYEFIERRSVARALLILVNTGVAIYLARMVGRERKARPAVTARAGE